MRDPQAVRALERLAPPDGEREFAPLSGTAAVRLPQWEPPELEPAALHGPAGTWAQAVQPFTEASVPGILVASLIAFGNAAGGSARYRVTATLHRVNEFGLLVGPTATGRKGEAMTLGIRPVRLADRDWYDERVQRGFGSGEAIVAAVHDHSASEDDDLAALFTDRSSDRRLLVFEDEFAQVLAVAGRDGSTLSPIVRDAWDGRKLQNRTKARVMTATDAHVSALAGITPEELARRVTEVEIANGFLNRFLVVAVKRAKKLPRPRPIPRNVEDDYVAAFAAALAFAREQDAREFEFSPDAAKLWDVAYGRDLSVDRFGLAGIACSRAEPHTLRLAVLYALLDRTTVIEPVHLEAAVAVWRYCERSALLVFGGQLGDLVADTILEALERSGSDGLTRSETHDLFGRHRPSPERERALGTLLALGRITETTERTGGRPTLRYRIASARTEPST